MTDHRHLARNTDGETSHLAAATIDTDLTERHRQTLDAIASICPATDLEMAEHLARLGFGKEESCRRVVRTLREEHGLLVAAVDADGIQIRHLNSTGRWAECWTPRPFPQLRLFR